MSAPQIKVSTSTLYVEQDDGDATIVTSFNTESDTNGHWYPQTNGDALELLTTLSNCAIPCLYDILTYNFAREIKLHDSSSNVITS